MRIEKIELLSADFPFLPKESLKSSTSVSLGTWTTCKFVIVKVYTDNGLVGYGESAPFAKISRMGQMPLCATINDYLAPAVIGMDPFDLQTIWKAMDRACPDNPQAKGVIDMAMYDLMGKATNLPAYKFMGGAVRDRIPLQAVICLDTIENMKAEAAEWIDSGFKTIRLKTGLGSLKDDMRMIEMIRESVGQDIKIRIDPNQAYSFKDAMKLIPFLEANDIEIYEQPINWADTEGMIKINQSTSIPVMPHESLANIYDAKELIYRGGASLFGLKTDRPGGITKALILRDTAELFNIPCVVMSSIELGISTFASMMIASTLKELPFACEASGSYSIEDVVADSNRIRNGEFLVPDGPGFGAQVDEEKLAFYTRDKWVIDQTSEIKD